MKINKFFYYFLNLTWGLPLTLAGLLVAFVLIITGHKPKHWGGCIYFNVGKWWGGLELGLVFLTDSYDSYHTKCHEYGHSLQNMIWGPFFIFFIAIPSSIRYWVFTFREKLGKTNPEYDSIWFEGQASRWGEQTIDQWKHNGKN